MYGHKQGNNQHHVQWQQEAPGIPVYGQVQRCHVNQQQHQGPSTEIPVYVSELYLVNHQQLQDRQQQQDPGIPVHDQQHHVNQEQQEDHIHHLHHLHPQPQDQQQQRSEQQQLTATGHQMKTAATPSGQTIAIEAIQQNFHLYSTQLFNARFSSKKSSGTISTKNQSTCTIVVKLALNYSYF